MHPSCIIALVIAWEYFFKEWTVVHLATVLSIVIKPAVIVLVSYEAGRDHTKIWQMCTCMCYVKEGRELVSCEGSNRTCTITCQTRMIIMIVIHK